MLFVSVLTVIVVSAAPADDVRADIVSATLQIERKDAKGGVIVGSAVAIAQRDGFCYALTAEHVVEKVRRMDIVAYLGDEKVRFPMEVLARSVEPDLALVRFPVKDGVITPLPIAEKSDELKKYPLPIITSGWEQGDKPTLTDDKALARKLLRRSDAGGAFFWQTAGTSAQGRSGGPIASKSGQLIGICSGNQDQRGYFTHRDEIHYFLRKQSSWNWLAPKDEKP